ncbi:MAG: hypothetical protein ACLSAF_15715 [Intestinimonas sp.]
MFYYLLSGKARSYISSASGGERTCHPPLRRPDGRGIFLTLCPRVSSCCGGHGMPCPVDRDRLTASSVLTRVWLS